MNKKNLLIVSALLIALVVVFSLFFPPADNSGTSGTVGKVDKYRNAKTGQDIIFFRNDFLKDTTSLKAVINLLAINENVIEKLPKEFKEWETSLKTTIAKDTKLATQFTKLNELGLFLSNNITTIKNTRELLTKYYTKDTVDMKIDVQNNLIQFDGFISSLNEKSRVIDTLFVNLDGMIDKDKLKKLTSTKEEAEKLKEIREKMLGTMAVYAITCGVQTTLNTVLFSDVKNMVAFNHQLNVILPSAQLKGNMPILQNQSDKVGVYAPFTAKEIGNQLNGFVNQAVFRGFEDGKGSKVDLNAIVYTNKVDMAVSNILRCKDLGIIIVRDRYYIGLKEGFDINGVIALESVLSNTANAIVTIGSLSDWIN